MEGYGKYGGAAIYRKLIVAADNELLYNEGVYRMIGILATPREAIFS